MKFSKQLCASADLRYLQAYIAYKDLKKAIKLITGADVECCTVRDVVSNYGGTTALTGSIFRPPESRFQDLLNLELDKINDFSRKKAGEILAALDNACSRVEVLRRSLLEEQTAGVSGVPVATYGHPLAPVADAADTAHVPSRGKPEVALKRASGGAAAREGEQQVACDDVFHSPAASEHAGSSTSTTWARNGAKPNRVVDEKGRNTRRNGFSSPTEACSTAAGADSKLNEDGGRFAEAAGPVSGMQATEDHNCPSRVSCKGGKSGREKSGEDELRKNSEHGDGRRKRLHATEQEERKSAAELLRVHQQLMELEGVLDEQSEEIIFLDSYVRLNFTGFRKITKKYDKHNGSAAASWYMHRVVKQDFMKLNFTLLLAKLASGYDGLTDAAQIFRQQQTRAFDVLLREPGLEAGECSEEGHSSSGIAKKSSSNRVNCDRSNSRNGSRASSYRRDTIGDEAAQSYTKHTEKEEGHEERRTLLKDTGQQQQTVACSSDTTVAAHAWTPLQCAAEQSASDPQSGPVQCLKYLVPPDMLMRGEVASSSMRNITTGEKTGSSSGAGTTASGSGTAAPGTQRKRLSRSSSLGGPADEGSSADKPHAAGRNVLPLLQVTPARRGKSHRSATLFDAAGGATARAASWRVYLDDTDLSFYTAALKAFPQPSWAFEGGPAAPAQSPLLLPRVRWHGQTTSLASPFSRVALDLCRVDESSASAQEDITLTYDSNSPGEQCPPRTVVLQQRQLLELLRGNVSSENLQMLLEEGTAGSAGDEQVHSGATASAHDVSMLSKKSAAGATAQANAAGEVCAAPAATTDTGDAIVTLQTRASERKAEIQRVVDYVSTAVRGQHISPCLRARFYRTHYRSRSGLVAISIDEDIRFSRELGKPVPSSQWLRSENEALATDDVQPFPWGVLDISFVMPKEQEQHHVNSSTVELKAASAAVEHNHHDELPAEASKHALSGSPGAAAVSAEMPRSLQQGPSTIGTATEGLQELLESVNSLSDVILVRGFSLFLHGVASLYTDRLQAMQLQRVKQQPHPQPSIDGGKQQTEIPGEASGTLKGDTERLLPHWFQYTIAMERQKENDMANNKQESHSREDHDDSNVVKTAVAGLTPSGNNYDEITKASNETGGGGRAGTGGTRRTNLIDVVHKGTSASLVHEWQATLEEEQSTHNESPAFADRYSYHGIGESAVPSGRAAASRLSNGLPRTYAGNGVDDYCLELPPSAVGHNTPQPTTHQEGMRQPLLTETRGYAAAEQETPGTNRGGGNLPIWLRRCGRHWLHCCSKNICCFPWASRRSARRLQQLREGGIGGASACGWGGSSIEVGGAGASAAAVRVEPKTFFANERTLLQWMNTAVLIATISITLMNFGSPIGRIAGLIMSPVAVFFIGYSFWVYLRRARALERKEPINYNDKLGPTVLVITLMCALSVVILLNVLYGGEEPPTTSAVSTSPAEVERPASHTKNHSKYAHPPALASPPAQNEEDMYDGENLPSHPLLAFTQSSEHGTNSFFEKVLPREAAAVYRYPLAHTSFGGFVPQQGIEEADSDAPSGGSTLTTLLPVVSDGVRDPVEAAQPVENFSNTTDSAGVDRGIGDIGDSAAAPGGSTSEVTGIPDAGLRPRMKMMKAAVGQKNSPVRAFSSSGLQMGQFEAAGHMPTHPPNHSYNDFWPV